MLASTAVVTRRSVHVAPRSVVQPRAASASRATCRVIADESTPSPHDREARPGSERDHVAALLGDIDVAALVHAKDAQAALSSASVIFEGVPEVLDLKREALARCAQLAGPAPIIASTTSTILVDGFVHGTWKITPKGKSATLEIRPYRPLLKKDVAALTAEGKRLLSFAAPEASHAVRFTQPR